MGCMAKLVAWVAKVRDERLSLGWVAKLVARPIATAYITSL
jgi:hypothetical protein